MVTLTSYGGADEIGGTKLLLEASGTRVFLDFGVSFRREQLFFEFPTLQARCLEDLMGTNMVPNLPGLYRGAGISIVYAESESQYSLVGEQEPPAFDAVLLSHAHTDHAGYLGLLHPDIPIYCSPVTKWMLQLLNEIRGAEFCSSDGGDSVQAVQAEEWIAVGDVRFKRYDVDHSLPGASAFLIEAEGKKIAYTGDLRTHGNGPGSAATQHFMDALLDEKPDCLICEGTRFPSGNRSSNGTQTETHYCRSEAEVQARCEEIFRRPGFIVYDMSRFDLDRLLAVMEAARRVGRRPVLDSRKGYMLAKARDIGLISGLPDLWNFAIILSRHKLAPKSACIRHLGLPDGVFVEARLYGRYDYERYLIESANLPGTVSVLWGPHGRRQVTADPDRHVVITSDGPLMLMQLLEPGGSLGGTYVYGKSEPFTEEMEFSFERLKKWLDLCGMQLEYAHASGHASHAELERFVEAVRPKVLIPVHTASDTAFAACSPKIVRLQYGCPHVL